jgi:XisI protein
MVNLEKYRECVQELLTKYGAYKPSYGDVEVEQIFDTLRDHYQLVHVGWENKRRVYGCSMHIDIKNEKIWIQLNGTEVDITEELISMGVPKEDIVIGFHSPYKRQFTDFAVG